MEYTIRFEKVGSTLQRDITTNSYEVASSLFHVLRHLDWPCQMLDTTFDEVIILETWHYND